MVSMRLIYVLCKYNIKWNTCRENAVFLYRYPREVPDAALKGSLT